VVATITEQPFTVANISRQLLELRDPHLAGYNPGVVREFLRRGRRPAGIRNHHSPLLSQGLCDATTAVP